MNPVKFWRYVREREHIRLRKESGDPWPWTKDKILQTYKFTNIKRANDQTTRRLLEIYRANRDDWEDVALYNAAVYRYFGTVDFAEETGWMKRHDRRHLVTTAARMTKEGRQVFTGAYIVTSGGRSGPKAELVAEYLGGLWRRRMRVVEALLDTLTWRAGCEELFKLDGFGGSGFMAKEVLQDWLLWYHLNTSRPLADEHSWTPMGPGGRRGLNRLYRRRLYHRQSLEKFVAECVDLLDRIQPLWKKEFKSAEPLTAHDVQFCLCEYDKYERVRLGQGRPRSLYRQPQGD